ncbi:MAG: DUF1476 domain-containing protein [Hyphomonas sp.]|nr:DUF1476 domain-containing protein [Hyphomonas sp.]MCB9971892.1 DUF1476 domain-containing protein [Hyphomonas sp.]
MGTFDDRERAAEAKFALSEEQNFKVTARRNKLLGLWVAGLMGMGEEDAAAYAKTVVLSDLQEVGDEDVFRKVRADIDAAGLTVTDAQIREQMALLLPEARSQILSDSN